MQNVALLLTALASMITALAGVGFGVWSVRRGSLREREDAAARAAERMLQPRGVDTAAVLTAIEEHYRRQPPTTGKGANDE